MEADAKTPLILRRPFLSIANGTIVVGTGEIHLNLNRKEERFNFKPWVERCKQVRISYEQGSSKVEKIEVYPNVPMAGTPWYK